MKASLAAAQANGEILWQAAIGGDGATWSAPVVVGGRVLVQGQDGGIGCLDAATGSLVWHQPGTEPSVASPIYSGGSIYLLGSSTIYKISPTDGSVQASRSVGDYFGSQAPAASDTAIYVSVWDGQQYLLLALSPADFEPLWSKPLGYSGHPMLDGGVLYVAADELLALDPATGNTLWSLAPPSGDYFNQAAVGDGYLAAVSNVDSTSRQSGVHVWRLSQASATPPSFLWSADLGGNDADNAPPAIDQGRVVVNSRNGVLSAFDPEGSATPLWTLSVRGLGLATALPAALDGKVLIQIEDAGEMQLACLDGASGALLWKTSTTGMDIAWGQPAVVGGVAYLATDWGGAYAVRASNVAADWYMIKQNPAQTGSVTDWAPPVSVNVTSILPIIMFD